ncbi:hypothetical protein [Xanthomonas populi]|uniref:hypothetical protein n=1 Tax=Xanthomonas populi TaxID=53414 RepID=UPI001FC9524C|nr:hypothetical protein [Xanthomonas populi]
MARSVRKRQAEYFFGRLAARQALQHQALVVTGTYPYIATGSSREPIWPAQVIGSISHTNQLAAAAAASSGRSHHPADGVVSASIWSTWSALTHARRC